MREVEALPVVDPQTPQRVPQAGGQVVIRHKAGDYKRREFWHGLVTSDPERTLIARVTAFFAVRTLLLEVQGFKAHRAQIDFDGDPTTLGDLFEKLERLCGGVGGWQLAQSLAGY